MAMSERLPADMPEGAWCGRRKAGRPAETSYTERRPVWPPGKRETADEAIQTCLHLDRAARGHSHHRHPGGHIIPGLRPDSRESPPVSMPLESEADRDGA